MNSSEHDGTDLGRRILRRRYEIGLNREEAAARAGMAPGYLEYLETDPAPTPTWAALARLAAALDISAGALAGAGLEHAPSGPPPIERPVLEPLSAAQCRGYLGSSGVGRFVVIEPRGPVAIPVNYAVLDGDIVVRTGAQTSLAARAGQAVSFEVDHVDEALATGWSVLVSGSAREVTTPYELETVRSLGIKPWAGGNRDTYIRIIPTETTGRRIRASASQHAEAADKPTSERR